MFLHKTGMLFSAITKWPCRTLRDFSIVFQKYFYKRVKPCLAITNIAHNGLHLAFTMLCNQHILQRMINFLCNHVFECTQKYSAMQ